MTGCCPYLYVGGVPHLYQTTHLLSPFLFVKSLLFLLRPLCSALLCVAFTKSQEFLPCRGGRIAAVMKCHLLALPLDLTRGGRPACRSDGTNARCCQAYRRWLPRTAHTHSLSLKIPPMKCFSCRLLFCHSVLAIASTIFSTA